MLEIGILRYLNDEAYKNGVQFDPSQWKKRRMDTPLQSNLYDCGIFVCVISDFLLEDLPLNLFSQDDMPFFRRRLCADILRGHN